MARARVMHYISCTNERRRFVHRVSAQSFKYIYIHMFCVPSLMRNCVIRNKLCNAGKKHGYIAVSDSFFFLSVCFVFNGSGTIDNYIYGFEWS